MPSFIQILKEYLPDKSVMDVRPPFDGDLSQPLFVKGGTVGCLVLHGIGGTPANVRVIVDALIEKGLIKSPADIYYLTLDDVKSLWKAGSTAAKKLLAAIEASVPA